MILSVKRHSHMEKKSSNNMKKKLWNFILGKLYKTCHGIITNTEFFLKRAKIVDFEKNKTIEYFEFDSIAGMV